MENVLDPGRLGCRSGCGACCIAVSISTPIPASVDIHGMPEGKPAGIPCPHLMEDMGCSIYLDPERPAVCAGLKPVAEMCGNSRDEALAYLNRLEEETRSR